MTVQGSNIHNILRTYNKQIKFGKVSDNTAAKSAQNFDKVSLSPDARKLMFISNVTAEAGIKSKNTVANIEQKLANVDFNKVSDEELKNIKKDILSEIS